MKPSPEHEGGALAMRHILIRLKRYKVAAIAILAGTLGVEACQGWEDWDNAFRKRYYGWMTSDAGYTVLLPGNRLMWVFGDTVTNGPGGGFGWVFGNTIGLQTLNAPPSRAPVTHDDPMFSSTGMRFYASLGNRPQGSGFIWDITWGMPDYTANFFRRSCTDNSWPTTLLWPGQGIYQSGILGQFTYELDSRLRLQHTLLQKYGNITETNDPTAWTCQDVVALPDQYSPFPPTDATLAADPALLWGQALVKKPGDSGTYIFGTRGTSANLAYVPNDAALFTYTSWLFYYAPGTTECPGAQACRVANMPPNTVARRDHLLKVASDVEGFSVDVVTHSEAGSVKTINATEFVMVHGKPAPLLDAAGNYATIPKGSYLAWEALKNKREISIRTTNDLTKWPGPNFGNYAYNGTTKIGGGANYDIIAKDYSDSIGSIGAADKNVISGPENAYRSIHAVLGHNVISEDGNIVVSYTVDMKTYYPSCPISQPTCSIAASPFLAYGSAADPDLRVSPFRFTKIPLNRIWPWCQAWNSCR